MYTNEIFFIYYMHEIKISKGDNVVQIAMYAFWTCALVRDGNTHWLSCFQRRARAGALLHLHVQEPAGSSDFFCTGGSPADLAGTAGDTFADGFVTVDPFCN